MGFTDTMLDAGCALHVEAAHGESIMVLTGADAGRLFTAIRENESDAMLNSETGMFDPRAKRCLRFRDSTGVPNLNAQDIIQTADKKKWRAVKNPQSGYLTTDFDLIEITKKDAQ